MSPTARKEAGRLGGLKRAENMDPMRFRFQGRDVAEALRRLGKGALSGEVLKLAQRLARQRRYRS